MAKEIQGQKSSIVRDLTTWSKGVMEKKEQKVRKFKDRSGAKANALWADISYILLI